MPKSRIMIQLEPETIEQVDQIRGAVPRAAWVRLLIEDRLRGGGPYFPSVWSNDVARDEIYIDGTLYKWNGLKYEYTPQEEGASSIGRTAALQAAEEGSTPSAPTGKGSPAAEGSQPQGAKRRTRNPASSERSRPESPSRPTKKGKACKHTNQIRKLGAAFCTDCGEFV